MSKARSDDVTIHYEASGSGPALLLIAGTGYPGATWPKATLRPLAEMYTTVIFDHRGTGQSDATADDYTTRIFAADAAAVLESTSLGPAHVVGHSMGGRVAQWLAADHGHLVRSLVLAASGPGARAGVGHGPRAIPLGTVLRLMEHGYEGFIRDLQRCTFFTDEFADVHGEEVTWLGDAFWDNRPSLESYLKHVIARQTHDGTAILGRLGCPALVIVGERDTHQGDTGSHIDQSRFLAEHLPNSELIVVPGVKHGLFWEQPRVTVSLITDWLSKIEAAPRQTSW